MRKRVLLPTPLIHPSGEELLEQHVEVVRGADLRDDVHRREALATVHGLYGRASAEELEAAEQLEVVASGGSGVDRIDVAAATAHGILVVNAAGAQAESVAEHAIGLLLAVAHRIGVSDRLLRAGRFPDRREYVGEGWPLGAPRELHGRTLGLVGLGFIGRAVARIASAGLGMRVLAHDPYVSGDEAGPHGVELFDDLDELVRTVDVLSLHLPLTDATAGLIGERRLRAMRPTAYLVNVARGGVVDEAALVRALTQGWIAGAGLDVFEQEPAPPDHPLFALDNVVITPHIAGWTAESLPALARTTAEQLLSALRGERPTRLVNPEVWDHARVRRA